MLIAGYRQAREFLAALSAEPRDRLGLVAARQLLSRVSAAVPIGHRTARSGRLDLSDSPAALLRPRRTIVWWHFVRPAIRPPAARWRERERAALAAVGVQLEDPALHLAAEAESWRIPLLRAQQRLLLVAPTWHAGERLEPHPLWSELQAAAGSSAALARVTVTAAELLADPGRLPLPVPIEELPPAPLPPSRDSWSVPAGLIGLPPSLSTSLLDQLVGCPLRFALGEVAGVRRGRIAAIPPTPVLAGTLGHRIVEELQREQLFGTDREHLARRAGEIFDALVLTEAAPLALAGASFERIQIRTQLIDAVVSLDRVLGERDLSMAGVEVATEMQWDGRALRGRIDVLCRRGAGEGEVIIDLKWGRRDYQNYLREGRAVQLATYARLRAHADRGGAVPAAYFSLSRGELLHTAESRVRWRSRRGRPQRVGDLASGGSDRAGGRGRAGGGPCRGDGGGRKRAVG